jgi:uncharacterized protein YjbJ (UPF0337 family)
MIHVDRDFICDCIKHMCVMHIRPHVRAMRAIVPKRGTVMNQDMIKGQWKQLSGNIKQHWGKLTDDDLKVAEGSSEYLAGKLEQRYGMAHAEAEKQVREFERQISTRSSNAKH